MIGGSIPASVADGRQVDIRLTMKAARIEPSR
jgi:hypothetical protein